MSQRHQDEEDIEKRTLEHQYIWENIFYLKLKPGENMFMPVQPHNGLYQRPFDL